MKKLKNNIKNIDIDLLKFLKIAFDTKPNHAFYNKKYKTKFFKNKIIKKEKIIRRK